MKITENQIHKAYELGKRVHSGLLNFSDAAEELSETENMNLSSAKGYIHTFEQIISGKEYQRTINAEATDYYLEQISKDFGLAKLLSAIESVKKHLQYYQGRGKSAQPKIRKILREHEIRAVEKLTFDQYISEFEFQVTESISDSSKSRSTRLRAADEVPQQITITTTIFKRNPDVVAEVLLRANGYCERCKKTAPFKKAKDGTPYLEVHHAISLAQGGKDIVDNALALCPNCHRELHYGART